MKLLKSSVILAGLIAVSTANAATTVYDNTDPGADLGIRFNPLSLEIGDEITLAGTDRYLSGFSFEYWGTASGATFAGTVQARVRFYQNNGALFNGYASPGTMFYDSDWFGIGAIDRATLNFTPGSDNLPASLLLPDTMTVSVQFQGLGTGDAAGVDLFGPVGVGSSYGDYWQYEGGSWSLKQNPAGPVNFAMEFQAVPEPSVLALLLGAGVVLFARRSK